MTEPEYELWRERWRVTEWKDDSISKTVRVDWGWWPEAEVKANVTKDTNLIYVPGGEHSPLVAIRKKRVE